MKVVLQENVENLGSVGEVLKVRHGYGRNFLLPRGLAVEATESNIRVVTRAKAKEIEVEKQNKAAAEELAKKIREMSITFEANVGDEGKLFGSVTNLQVQELLAAQGVDIDKKHILIAKPIRKVGAYEIEIRCYTNIKAPLKFWVTKKK